MIKQIKNLFTVLSNIVLTKKIIIFCESKNIYEKVLKKELNYLIKENMQKKIVFVSFKNDMSYVVQKDIVKINFKNEFFLRLFFKTLKKSIVISTTPTINKTLSNSTNKFFFTQHSLCLLSNDFIGKNFFDFDIVCVNNYD